MKDQQKQNNSSVQGRIRRRRMFNSMDLFSGVGGITHALSGICKPVMYCDICPFGKAVLRSNMKKGLLPKAPIVNDVRDITKQKYKGPRIDMIVGGFPCQGFSPVGKRNGLAHEQSGLYYQVIRLIDEFNPSMVFLENVPSTLNSLFDVLKKDLTTRNYAFSWTVIPASFMGAPHERARWFCFAVKMDHTTSLLLQKPFTISSDTTYKRFNWSDKSIEPNRTLDTGFIQRKKQSNTNTDEETTSMTIKAANLARLRLLGNAVVPDAVRFAFFVLASAFTQTDITANTIDFIFPKIVKLLLLKQSTTTMDGTLSLNAQHNGNLRLQVNHNNYASISNNASNHNSKDKATLSLKTNLVQNDFVIQTTGFVTNSIQSPVYSFKLAANILRELKMSRQVLKLKLDPVHNNYGQDMSNYNYKNNVARDKLITRPIALSKWATPRRGVVISSRILTERGLRDLPTQVRFEHGTKNRFNPLNSQWVEYLMGYPLDWTIFNHKYT